MEFILLTLRGIIYVVGSRMVHVLVWASAGTTTACASATGACSKHTGVMIPNAPSVIRKCSKRLWNQSEAVDVDVAEAERDMSMRTTSQ